VRRGIAILILISILSLIYTCAFRSRSISIAALRIEDANVNDLLNQPIQVEDIKAQWYGDKIEIFSTQNATNSIAAYISTDEYTYESKTANNLNTIGTIISLKDRSEANWDDYKDLETTSANDLVFIISPQQADDKYRDMVYIPGGSFYMGSKFKKDEKPVHLVYINGFYMDKYLVTVADYREFCRKVRRRMPEQPYWNNENHPVVNVSWNDARLYAKWKGKRLATEAEWEYAARCGIKGYYYSWGNRNPFRKRGGNIADESLKSEKPLWRIWKKYYDGFPYTSPVGSFYSNEFGLYDMTGNAWEWCSDWYDASYYKNSPENNPKGPKKGTHKVLRGGSWNFSPRDILTTRRFHYRPTVNINYIGFRCVKNK
jgi:formylglycine-generating enzyme required for sulfatase activity